MGAVSWPDRVDEILGGDITAALGYLTPAGGAVVTAVSPIGLRDRAAGTVTFTTSLGFGRKLERIQRDHHVALGYHSREHGFATGPLYVLVQGEATISLDPDERFLDEVIAPRAERYLGPRKRGWFWDRWLREYYRDRVPVEVSVRRVASWPDLGCRGEPQVDGDPLPVAPPDSQREPQKGTGPRVDASRAARRCRSLPHQLLAFRGVDGYPMVVPVEVGEADDRGFAIEAPAGLLPHGARRAGVLAHGYKAQLTGLAARQLTGWLTVDENGARYSPHTQQGFRAPSNKTLLLFLNGMLAKRGLREARRSGRLERLRAG